MNASSPAEYVEHIKAASQDARSFIDGISKFDFLNDKRTQNAVVMCLIVIGEAAAKLMDKHPEYVQTHSQVPWRNMRGMRNRIAHGYFEINLELVWETTQSALPELLTEITKLSKES